MVIALGYLFYPFLIVNMDSESNVACVNFFQHQMLLYTLAVDCIIIVWPER